MKKRRDFLRDGAHACAVAVAAGATGLANRSTAQAAEGQKYLLNDGLGNEDPGYLILTFIGSSSRDASGDAG
jgi:hypothetical protein